MPERIELLEGVSKKHKKDIDEAEKKLAVYTNLRAGQGNGAAAFEQRLTRRNEGHQKLMSLVEGHVHLEHSIDGDEAEENSTSAGPSLPIEVSSLSDELLSQKPVKTSTCIKCQGAVF